MVRFTTNTFYNRRIYPFVAGKCNNLIMGNSERQYLQAKIALKMRCNRAVYATALARLPGLTVLNDLTGRQLGSNFPTD